MGCEQSPLTLQGRALGGVGTRCDRRPPTSLSQPTSPCESGETEESLSSYNGLSGCLCILEINPLSVVSLLIFSHSEGCLFMFPVSFVVQSFQLGPTCLFLF